ncbi:hypothetical protein [uncultured Tateyamaria sp.]|uniref:hypothetical protein n=1 Tax=uncultured Tateyamaria sp. TaxID=455651 RepID=UPI0026221FCF|nr:hypothetical protein [uncultured Tateyamaria sp.]
MMVICLGILALSLAFGVAWINTRIAGLFWVSANFLAYQWTVEATRMDPQMMAMAANVTLFLLIVYLSVMSLSGIGAAHMLKRARSRGAMA